MKCERSRKRNLLKIWGMKALGNGKSFEEVAKTIGKMMKKTLKPLD
ncbi:MAG: hypothetical protein M0P12_01260 [Paludibacteraceae bacterium]|nr:hypothetical protein [Paludibacteraceae bacterium]